MVVRVVLVALIATLLFAQTAVAHEHEPAGTIVLGVDPAFYVPTMLAANTWTNTGYVAFTVVAGCGNGELNVCWGPPGYDPSWVSGYNTDAHVIWVWMPDLFTEAVACHELGHALGLWYERYDDLSCMHHSQPSHAYPDAQDLAALGMSVPIVPEEAIIPPAPLHDGTGGPLMEMYP
jgi:hypothetical protein